MERYLFLLGRTPELSLRELQAVGYQGELLAPHIFVTSSEQESTLMADFANLGGSTKLLKIVGEFTSIPEEELSEYVAAYFAQFDRPTFAIGELGRDHLPKLQLQDIKNSLKKRDISSRFIDGSREGLSASVLSHQKVEELVVIRLSDEKTLFAQTLAVQDIDDWTLRDREKPYADRRKGMLPPKVGRMMVNIGLGELKKHSDAAPVIYDPFCGTGTILLEAAMSGHQVVGSDLDMDAVKGATLNLEWLGETYDMSVNYSVFQSDATKAEPDQFDSQPNVIVTEPFLGKQTPNPAQLPNIYRGMEKMYLGAFKQWRKVLADNAIVVMVFPVAQDGKTRFSLESLIDKIAPLGYTATSDPSLYYRPQAVIQRQIWTFQFKKQ
jgi:tRNA G10  N-methylase Trm11